MLRRHDGQPRTWCRRPASLSGKQNPALAEDYRLRYALGVETAGSASLLGSNFVNPFAYTLSVVRDGARQPEAADLPETFNYLIGLRVVSRRRIDGVLATTGVDAENRQCLILWRNLEETDHRALDAWFTRNRPRSSPKRSTASTSTATTP